MPCRCAAQAGVSRQAGGGFGVAPYLLELEAEMGGGPGTGFVPEAADRPRARPCPESAAHVLYIPPFL